jgi:hypothetical protein
MIEKLLSGIGRIKIALLIAAVACGALVGGCSEQGLSGQYIAKFQNGLVWLQITQTSDQRLTGQLEKFVLKDTGDLKYQTFSVTGAADGKNVALVLKGTSLLAQTINVAGTFDGKRLTLIGDLGQGQPSGIVLVRSDVREYVTQGNVLKEQSRKILEAKAATEAKAQAAAEREKQTNEMRKATQGILELVQQVETFNKFADGLLRNPPKAEEMYRSITSTMHEYLRHQRQLAGNDKAAVKRSQIVVAINEGQIKTDQVHYNAQSEISGTQAKVRALKDAIGQATRSCGTPKDNVGDQNVISAMTTACERLSQENAAFDRNYEAINQRFEKLEVTYREEQQKQHQIADEAARIE